MNETQVLGRINKGLKSEERAERFEFVELERAKGYSWKDCYAVVEQRWPGWIKSWNVLRQSYWNWLHK